MSVCAMPMVAAKKRGQRSDDRDHHQRDRRALKNHVRARNHVDARRHHGRRVDQRRDRRRAFHGVRQPDIERNLRRLAARAHHQQNADRGEQPGAGGLRARAG